MTRLAKVVFGKELKETLRDKRVLLGVIVSPLLLTPVLMATIFFFAGKKTMELQSATLEVGILELEPFPELVSHIEQSATLNVSQFRDRDAAIAAILALSTRAVVVAAPGARQAYLENGSAQLEILFNRANENSENARSRLRSLLRDFDADAVQERLSSAELPDSLVRPTTVAETSVAEKEALVGFFLSMILPYLVVMGAAFGGITTAFDLCAGEKERGTMETLLVAPISRGEIVQGKLGAIFCVSLLSALCSILGILIVMLFGGHFAKTLFDEELSFSYLNLFALVLIVIPLSLFTSAGLLLVSSFARNQKEAQAYLFPFIALIIFPAVLSSIFGAESPLYTAFIPVLNTALAMKQLLGGLFDPTYFGLALGSSLAYALLAMRAAAALFQREAILFRA